MRKQILGLSLGLISMSAMAQKSEIKSIEKAVKNGNYTAALAEIKKTEEIIGGAENKYKTKFLYLKGQTFAAKKDYKKAAESFNSLIKLEKQIGNKKYTAKAAPMLNTIIKEVSDKAIDLYNNKKNYRAAAENFYLTYLLSPKDTSFAFNAAVSATQATDYTSALRYYKELKRIGYTGISTQYLATNKANGKEQSFRTKKERDNSVKLGLSTKPRNEVTKSKKATIVKNIALILSNQGKTDEAIRAIKEARRADPRDVNLILNEADLYIKLNKMDKFGKLMKEAVALDPNNPNLYYNLGVVNANQGRGYDAIKYYKKAIELKPDYADAYMNLAAVILEREKPIVDEMNKNLSNFKKYDQLAAQQKNVYRQALPYLEKADKYKRSEASVKTLMNMYSVLGQTSKEREYRNLYKSMR